MKKQYTRKQIQEAIAYWEKVLESAEDEESKEEDVVVTPHEKNKAEEEEFIEQADKLFKGGVYDAVVSSTRHRVEGVQCDFDDYDVYEYSEQDAIDEEEFWEKIFDALWGPFDEGQRVPADIMKKWLERVGKEIAKDAFDNFEPDGEYLVHAGRCSTPYWSQW